MTVLDLPSVVESYKTLDDVNLVKTTDIGQVLVVGEGGAAPDEAAALEARDGVTPPMRNARGRVFRKPIDVSPQVVQKVEFDLLTILAVSEAGGQAGSARARKPRPWLCSAVCRAVQQAQPSPRTLAPTSHPPCPGRCL